MNSLFSIRTEVWHPLSVHLPVGLLSTATLLGLISLFLKAERKKLLVNSCTLLLLVGTVGAWISIYTGDMADGIVARTLCDPTLLKKHEIAAFNVAYLFSAASLLHILMTWQTLKIKLKTIFFASSIVLMAVGTGYLIYAGHLGASLVYEQGAAVNKPSADCSGYK